MGTQPNAFVSLPFFLHHYVEDQKSRAYVVDCGLENHFIKKNIM